MPRATAGASAGEDAGTGAGAAAGGAGTAAGAAAAAGEAGAGSNAGAVSRREQRRRQHHELSRAQLLDAAEEVFGRKGFHETTLKEVAELAEFSVGSVYSFFDNKDDLFRQIFVRRGDQFMSAMRTALADDGVAPLEQLHRLVDLEVGFFREHRHFGRLFLRYSSATMMSADRRADAAVVANYDDAMELQAGVFSRGQSDGTLRAGDPQVLARLFSGLISAYQAMDPAVIGDGGAGGAGAPAERYPLDELHDLVEGAFRA
jgi:AcrR family transcriptional regulator